MKAFQLKCSGCGSLIDSVSWRGVLAALKRHATKHPKKDFPLGYQVIRLRGKVMK